VDEVDDDGVDAVPEVPLVSDEEVVAGVDDPDEMGEVMM